MDHMTSEIRLRIVVLGAAKVGKTCIISRFLTNTFKNKYKATVDDYLEGELRLNGVQFMLEIIDTAGSYTFPAMDRLSIATADAIVLVYSLADSASFHKLIKLRRLVAGLRQAVPIIVVGNKSDLKRKGSVPDRDAMFNKVNFEWDCGYIEVSAKDGINIGQIFTELILQENWAAKVAGFRSRKSAGNNDHLKQNSCCTIS